VNPFGSHRFFSADVPSGRRIFRIKISFFSELLKNRQIFRYFRTPLYPSLDRDSAKSIGFTATADRVGES